VLAGSGVVVALGQERFRVSLIIWCVWKCNIYIKNIKGSRSLSWTAGKASFILFSITTNSYAKL